MASTDCIHYLAFGDLLPEDMRHKIAARTIHASMQRQQILMNEAGRELSLTSPCNSASRYDHDRAFLVPVGLGPTVDTCEEPSSSPRAAVAHDATAKSEALNSSGADLPTFSCSCGSPRIRPYEHLSVSIARQALVISAPLAAAALWWLWSTYVLS
jgi:hypothetical protein